METIEQKIIRQWKSDPDLRAEFMGDITAYEAYLKACDKGLVRILGK